MCVLYYIIHIYKSYNIKIRPEREAGDGGGEEAQSATEAVATLASRLVISSNSPLVYR